VNVHSFHTTHLTLDPDRHYITGVKLRRKQASVSPISRSQAFLW